MITITDLDGVEHDVFATLLPSGVLWQMVRCPDEATFDAVALAVGLTVYTTPEIPAVLDENGVEIHPLIEASGPIITAPHTTITKIGSIVLTPAITDSEGNVTTPAVLDSRFHANFWLGPEVVARGLWKKFAIAWTTYGSNTSIKNHNESGVTFQNIELIDPDSITSPRNVLL